MPFSVPIDSGSSTVVSGTPARAEATAASSRMGAATTTSFAPESRSTYSISSALKSRCTGTTTAPSDSTA